MQLEQLILLVPEGGLEPPFPKGRRILSPLCLPISPLGPSFMLPESAGLQNGGYPTRYEAVAQLG